MPSDKKQLSDKKQSVEPEAPPAFPQEAALRDHKVIGQESGLYMTSPDVGPGLIMLPPKGAMLRYQLEQFGQKAHLLNGYQWVYTPHIGRAELWQTSGHLDFYQDAMYRPIQIDNESYYLKPMNCPFHIMIYNDKLRSYRELPLRYAEYGTVYRYELSGVLNGLTRVRGFTQDDAHIICTLEQSLERFMALLIEHYNGDFPFWLAPVQIGIVPVRQDHMDYAAKTARQLKQLNCRVDLLEQDLHLRNRIKHYEMEKVPYLLIVGDKEAESETVSVRSRREGQLGAMRLEQFIGHLSDQIRQGEPQCLFD